MTDPITLAMMIDTSGSEEDFLGAEKETASRFCATSCERRSGDAVSFDTQTNLLADFTDDQQILEAGHQKAEINAPSSLDRQV